MEYREVVEKWKAFANAVEVNGGDVRALTIEEPATEMEMPLALAHAWANAESPEDAAYWGGKWTARSILAALVQLPPEKL